MAAPEKSPAKKGKVFTWEGEPGVQAYSIAGSYTQELIDNPFGGYFYRQESSRRIFGRIIDPEGSANILGRMRENNLFFIKLYDPQAGQTFTKIPIFYKLANKEDDNWSGSYRIQGTPSVRSEVECRVTELEIPAPELTFVHDDPFGRSQYDNVFLGMRARLAAREAEILRYHPEKGAAIQRVRGFRGDPPRVQL